MIAIAALSASFSALYELKREQVLSFAELEDLVRSIERGEGELTADEELKEVEEVEEVEREWTVIAERKEYITPGKFSPPNPIGNLLYALLFIIPLLLFFFSLSAFEAFIARSYREMSFISLMISLLVALYVLEKLIHYQNRLRAERGIHVPELKMYLNGLL